MYERPQVRITTWPGTVLPTPKILLSHDAIHMVESTDPEDCPPEPDGFLCFWPLEHPETRELPGELYLRELMDLQLGDTSSIEAFCSQYGPLGSPDRPYHELLPDAIHLQYLDEYSKAGDGSCLPVAWGEPDLGQLKRLATAKRGLRLQTIRDFRVHAWALRNGVRVLFVLGGRIGEDELAGSWEYSTPPKDFREAVRYLEGLLNRGLGPFHACVTADFEPSQRLTQPQSVRGFGELYSVICLQMLNFLAEGIAFRECQNETCRRLFVRQLGRSRKDIHRTAGVDFCSASCARAQAARQLRRNRTRANQLRREGLSIERIAAEMETDTARVERWLQALDRRGKDR